MMIEDTLSELLKKYINIFINEYSEYLSKEQLDKLQNINYQKIITFDNLDVPFGKILFNKIYLSNVSHDLINCLSKMDNYNSIKYSSNNKNLSSYLQYLCDNGYRLLEYLEELLMYFVFDFVITNKNSFNNGLINSEIKYLSIKYAIKYTNLYAKEEMIISKITPIYHINSLRKILFMDKPSSFKYLNDNYGFRYAKLIDEITHLMDNKQKKIYQKKYIGLKGFFNYVEDYDKLSYGDIYNYLLDFEIKNKGIS